MKDSFFGVRMPQENELFRNIKNTLFLKERV